MSKLISCLVLNAIKFTEEGLITVAVTWGPNARHVVVSVEDTGSGIPRSFQPSLFQAFSREDVSLTRRQDGLGLGLLVAKGIARKIRGDVLCVRSETEGPRRGSLFEIRIPTSSRDVVSAPGSPSPTPVAFEQRRGDDDDEDDDDDDDDADADAPASKRAVAVVAGAAAAAAVEIGIGDEPTPDRPDLQLSISSSHMPSAPNDQYRNGYERPPVGVPDGGAGTRLQRTAPARVDPRKSLNFDRGLATKYPLTFLVVEDNHINRKLLVNMLSKLGYTDVYEAFDGLEAIRQMNERRDPAVDVILMDLWMPRMDGFDATRHILGKVENGGSLPPHPSSPSSVPLPSPPQRSSSLPKPSPQTSSPAPVAMCPMLQRLNSMQTGTGTTEDTGTARQACDGDTQMTTTTTTKSTAGQKHHLTVLAVTADVTAEASARAEEVGMKGLMTKPFKLVDLERSILRYCVDHLKLPDEQGV